MRLLILLLLWPLTAAAQDCHRDVACQLGDRSYHVREPDGWTGDPLPVLLHFHGWQRQGDLIVNHDRIAGHTRRRGVLLVAPNGINKTWNFWRGRSSDVDFAKDVLEDIAKRYPINETQIYVSGYSFGSAMAWRFVCEEGEGIRALLAISGTLNQNETCPEAPQEVRHVHGLDDTVMDYPFGPGGDDMYPVQLWRDIFGCENRKEEGDYNIRNFLTLTRYTWNCEVGHLTFDQHPGGHFIPHGWLGWQLDQLMGRTPRYP